MPRLMPASAPVWAAIESVSVSLDCDDCAVLASMVVCKSSIELSL